MEKRQKLSKMMFYLDKKMSIINSIEAIKTSVHMDGKDNLSLVFDESANSLHLYTYSEEEYDKLKEIRNKRKLYLEELEKDIDILLELFI